MSLTKKVAFNTIIQIIAKVITTITSLFLIAALTRYLGVSGFGQYTTIFAYLSFFGVLADFGFFWILVREISNPENDIDYVTSNILTLRTIVGIIVFGASFIVSLAISQYKGLEAGIGIAALSMLFLALNSTYVGVFQNKLRMDKAAITDVLGRFIILGLTLYLIRYGFGLSAILWAYALGNLVNLLASAFLGRVYVKFKPIFDLKYWKKIFFETWPMAVVLILNLIYFRVDTFMLSIMKTSTDVGIYGPPYKVLEMLSLIPTMFMGNVFPIISRYIYAKDERLSSALQKAFDFLLITAMPSLIIIIAIAKPIIQIVAGEEFVVAQTISPIFGQSATSVLSLQILVVAVAFSFLSIMFNYLVIALGKQIKLIWPNLFFAVFNVTLNFLLIPKYSYIGAAVTTVLTEFLILIVTWQIVKRLVYLKLSLKTIYKVLISGLFMTLIFVFGSIFNLNWIIITVASMIVYASSLWLLKAIDKEMLMTILKKGE